MNTIEKTDYQLPEVTVIDIAYEGVVCSSNEILDEKVIEAVNDFAPNLKNKNISEQFYADFKKVFGVSPLQYRKSKK